MIFIFRAAHESRDSAARQLKGDTARNDQQGVHVKHSREMDVLQRRSPLTNDQSTSEGGEAHGDGRQTYPDAGARRRRGGVFDAPQVSAGGNQIAPTPVSGTLAGENFSIDFWRFAELW